MPSFTTCRTLRVVLILNEVMTENQRNKFYFPKWRRLQAAFDWHLVGGRLLADLAEQDRMAQRFAPYVCEIFRKILALAQELALKERRAVMVDDLRHACNWIASEGKTTSSSRMKNYHVDNFDRLHLVLLKPFEESDESVWLSICWHHPEEDTRRRKIRYLRILADEGRLVAISRNAWGTSVPPFTDDIDALSVDRVDALIAEIKRGAWRKYSQTKPRITRITRMADDRQQQQKEMVLG